MGGLSEQLTMTTPAPQARAQLRWMVRREYVRATMFGEQPARAGVIQWAVTPYLGRFADGRLHAPFAPKYFPTRTRAFEWARSECDRVYRRKQR